MHVAEVIRRKLADALAPEKLEVVDESALHAGHAGARPEGESHFRVLVVSKRFEGMGRVARQREVYRILVDEFAAGVHALALRTMTPDEDRPA